MKPKFDTVVDAAFALARLVKEHGKPVAFDMELYAGIVGVGQHVVDMDIAVPPDPTPEEQAAIKAKLSKFTSQTDENRAVRLHFIESLSDAFTLDEVYAIQPCVLYEVGWTDAYPALCRGENDGYVFIVAPQPTVDQVHILEL